MVLDQRDQSDNQVLQVFRELKGLQEPKDSKELRVHKELKERRVPMQELKGFQVQPVRKVLKVLKGQIQVLKEPKVLRV